MIWGKDWSFQDDYSISIYREDFIKDYKPAMRILQNQQNLLINGRKMTLLSDFELEPFTVL